MPGRVPGERAIGPYRGPISGHFRTYFLIKNVNKSLIFPSLRKEALFFHTGANFAQRGQRQEQYPRERGFGDRVNKIAFRQSNLASLATA